MYFGLVVLLDSGLTTWARTLMFRQLLARMHTNRHASGATTDTKKGPHALEQPLLAGSVEGGEGVGWGGGHGADGGGDLRADQGLELDLDDGLEDEDKDVRAERLAVQRGALGCLSCMHKSDYVHTCTCV